MALDNYREDIACLLAEGKTYGTIADELKKMGLNRRTSVANIRKFCRDNCINPRRDALSNESLDAQVSKAILEVNI